MARGARERELEIPNPPRSTQLVYSLTKEYIIKMSHPTFAKVVSRDLQNTQFPARFYVDLNMTNSNYEKPAVPIEFNEARAEPIIKDAEAYNVAVARFHIDTLTLPLWIPLLQQGEVNNTILFLPSLLRTSPTPSRRTSPLCRRTASSQLQRRETTATRVTTCTTLAT